MMGVIYLIKCQLNMMPQWTGSIIEPGVRIQRVLAKLCRSKFNDLSGPCVCEMKLLGKEEH